MSSVGPLGGLIVLVAVIAVVLWRARTTHFACPTCWRSFKASFPEYFFTRHSLTGRYVTCPYCHTGAMLTPVPDRHR
jgi:DNA-directed RNA polymerase subunit RPC12/RpoP